MLAPAPAPTVSECNHDFPTLLEHQARSRPKGERTRARIRIAACALLGRHGPQAMTVSALCRDAGIAHGTFYLYFADLNALLADVLLGFTAFLQDGMREAAQHRHGDTLRASTTAYVEMFRQNAGLMNCLLHHHETFPAAREAFHTLNSAWIGVVVNSVRKRLKAEGRAEAIAADELQRRAHALGGMVDQYLSGLYLSADPALVAVSSRKAEVIDTLCLIWERGLAA